MKILIDHELIIIYIIIAAIYVAVSLVKYLIESLVSYQTQIEVLENKLSDIQKQVDIFRDSKGGRVEGGQSGQRIDIHQEPSNNNLKQEQNHNLDHGLRIMLPPPPPPPLPPVPVLNSKLVISKNIKTKVSKEPVMSTLLLELQKKSSEKKNDNTTFHSPRTLRLASNTAPNLDCHNELDHKYDRSRNFHQLSQKFNDKENNPSRGLISKEHIEKVKLRPTQVQRSPGGQTILSNQTRLRDVDIIGDGLRKRLYYKDKVLELKMFPPGREYFQTATFNSVFQNATKKIDCLIEAEFSSIDPLGSPPGLPNMVQTISGLWARYSKLSVLGQGVYGKVHLAESIQEQKSNKKIFVAVKETLCDVDGILPTTIREIAIMNRINHINIVGLIEAYQCMDTNTVYIVMEYFPQDLYAFLTERRNLMNEPNIVQRFMKHLLDGLAEMHHHGLMHRDIKPQNLLISTCQENKFILKIADFGLGRRACHLMAPLTPEVQTMLYRAPELFCGVPKYTFALDVWSAGCVFAEMFRGDPIFRGGRELELFNFILRTLGEPTLEEWKYLDPDRIVDGQVYPATQASDSGHLKDLIPGINDRGIDLIREMFRYRGMDRITAADAGKHSYFED